MHTERTKGYVAILFSTFLYGWFGVLVKMIGTEIPIFFQTLSRNSVIVGALFVILVLSRQKFRITHTSDLYKIVARASFGFVNVSTALVAFQQLSIGLAYILFFAGLMFGSFAIGTIYDKEKLSKIKLISLSLTIAGVITVYAYRTELSGDIIYMFLAVFSGLCVAFWNVFARYIREDLSATALGYYDSIFLALFSLIASLLFRETWVLPSFSTVWGANMAMALTFICAGVLVPYGFRRVEVQVGSILLPLEIVFGVVFGYLFFHEVVNLPLIIGCALIIVASVLPHVWEMLYSRRIRTL